jgi:hypothetical protein
MVFLWFFQFIESPSIVQKNKDNWFSRAPILRRQIDYSVGVFWPNRFFVIINLFVFWLLCPFRPRQENNGTNNAEQGEPDWAF